MPFENSITGGQGALIRPAIKSPNFVAGSTGWTINRDGSAEFNDVTVRGTIVAGAISAGSIGSSNIVNSNFNGGTINQTRITFDSTGGALFVYSTSTVTTTFNSGSGNFANPAGITSLQVECWGGGGGGGGGEDIDLPGFRTGGAGGGGGEYSADFAVAVTPSTNYAYSVGAGGTGGGANDTIPATSGGSSTFTGNSVTVTANGGGAGAAFGMPSGTGGTGSTNSVHFNGGTGGTSSGNSTGGGGGGGSGGTSSNGNNGGSTTTGSGGSGGTAVTGGGAGGNGGAFGAGGTAGSAPGGGGGGSGDALFNGSAGAAGRVRITYVSSSTLVAAIAPASGTDPVNGTAYPAGISGIEAGVDYVRLGSNGNLEYGASGSAADTNLFRNAANVLRTNDALTVDGALTASSTLTATGAFTASSTTTATGSIAVNGGMTRSGATARVLTQSSIALSNANLTLGTTAADVSNCSITFSTVVTNASYWCQIVTDAIIDGAGSTTIGTLVIDTVTQSQQALFAGAVNERATVTQTYVGTLSSTGSHTFKMQGARAGGSSRFLSGHTSISLMVFE